MVENELICFLFALIFDFLLCFFLFFRFAVHMCTMLITLTKHLLTVPNLLHITHVYRVEENRYFNH